MPFSILKKVDDDKNNELENDKNNELDNDKRKELEKNDQCVKEFTAFEKCESENKDCTDLLTLLLKCSETPNLEKKEE